MKAKNKKVCGVGINDAEYPTQKREYLGRFDTPQKAHSAYITRKVEVIRSVAKTQPQKIREALLNYASALKCEEG